MQADDAKDEDDCEGQDNHRVAVSSIIRARAHSRKRGEAREGKASQRKAPSARTNAEGPGDSHFKTGSFVRVEAHHRVGTAAVSGRPCRVGRVVLLLRRQRRSPPPVDSSGSPGFWSVFQFPRLEVRFVSGGQREALPIGQQLARVEGGGGVDAPHLRTSRARDPGRRCTSTR